MNTLDDRLRTRLQVEEFLYHEAELLDQWRLDEWLALYTKDCRYIVGPTGKADAAELSPETSLFLIADDRFRLEQRVIRMKKPSAHAEYPHSRTRHLYSNISVLEDTGDRLQVGLNFLTFRTSKSITHQYIGRIRLDLVAGRPDDPAAPPHARTFLVAQKRMTLDLDSLVPQGKVTIFL
jgi:p-cumate 2,3-dioxygenase beta subunit